MTFVGVSLRRTLGLLLAVVLLFGATSVVASQSADAAFPGGNGWIVFTGDGAAPPDTELFAMRADGTGLVNITQSLFIQDDAAISPDGTKVAYTQYDEGSPAIYVADLDTSGTPIVGVKITSGGDTEPTWSPNGAEIAFQRTIPAAIGVPGTNDTLDATGQTLEDTDTGTFVTDGVAVGDVVTNTRTNAEGRVTSVTSNTVLVMADGLAGGTPDNQWQVGDGYSIERRNHQIYKAPANGSNPSGTRLSPSGSQLSYTETEPAWSSTNTIAFVSTAASSNSDIWTMSSSGGSRANRTSGGSFDNVASRPSWAPDGSRIAFQIGETAGQPTSADKNIWTITSSGSSPIQITGPSKTGSDDDLEPTWSPDGTKIAFRRGIAGADNDPIYVINSNGSGSAQLVGGAVASNSEEPDWQPVLIAVADAYAVDEGATLNVDAASGVLDNDLTLSVGTASVAVDVDVSNGDLTLNPDGSFTYTHDDTETTSDSFTYTVTQGSASDTAIVAITVNPVDEDPIAQPNNYFVSNAATLNVPAPGVLDNDVDPEGGPLTSVKVADPTHGSLTLNPNGSFTYTHDGTDTLFDSFTYQARDLAGNLSAVTSVSLTIGPINPDPPSVTISGPSAGLPGAAASFTSTVTDGSGPRTYSWTVTRLGTTIETGSEEDFSFTPIETGTHTVTLTVVDDAGADTESVGYTVLTDVAGSTFADDIIWLANEGITRGCNPPANDQFCPDNNVTRGQMAAFLVRFLDLTDIDPTISFTDTGSSIFENDILKLATAGITRGCNADGTQFCPDATVTRGQMAAFLGRALNLTDNGGGDLFEDDDDSIFENDIDKLATAGITRGCNPPANTNFCPNGSVTRGQMAAFLNRADGLT